mgnify:CR=1 FL=1
MIRSIAAYLFAAFIAVIPAATAQVTVNISEGTLKPNPGSEEGRGGEEWKSAWWP